MESAGTISLVASDVSGQKTMMVDDVPIDATIGELIESVVPQMNLPRNDIEGRPLTYHALNEQAGRHLHATDRIADSVQSLDHIIFQPDVDAG